MAFTKSPKVAKVWRPFNFSAFLLRKNSDMTPSAEQDLQHMQAGLGKRTLLMGDDMAHSEVSTLFESAFPKLKTITGGWLLYKAAGGNGRRHLSVVPPESEGYTGSTIRSASGGGKTMLYIVPLQEEFDLVPLACDAQEFSLMPKAECKNCFKVMPLQLLALHVKQCDVLECDSDSEPGPTQGQCPVCQMEYPVVELEQHASSCGELEINSRRAADHDGNCNMSSEAMHSFQSSEDVLDWISYQVDEGSTFPLCVRSDLFNRGMQQWQRQ
ncbi:uncharacterized protein LOC121681602 [Alosa sapidissima]|uniref:uncharacterized protein LOC121681602 n=1 Tax=Alosa sapidissima TaxID=34773 RepID=UPI001C09D0ED|nr:uncharacterized protein LOC121681602 [Alosa sapidissima]XP_041917360.1 uncharacterized protein LOC121681602 [Alosa sapidissima]